MTQNRREFLSTSAIVVAGITLLPYAAHAASHSSDVFPTAAGDITVHPVNHASFVMETPVGVIYCDPVGEPSAYAGLPPADLILVTHEHGDHFKPDTLAALIGDDTMLITNPAVYAMLSDDLKGRATPIANGETSSYESLSIDAIPAYNTTEGRLQFHPEGRDNGYVLGFEDFRVYISGDTEDIPEMRALENIDVAFVCMNLPFTMDAEAAASAVAEFKPKYVYPYHYRGRDGGTQNPEDFARLVGAAAEVRMGGWYS